MKYHAELDWSGYSRGYMTVEVEAESLEEAEEKLSFYEFTEIARDIIRDDTETDVSYINNLREAGE